MKGERCGIMTLKNRRALQGMLLPFKSIHCLIEIDV